MEKSVLDRTNLAACELTSVSYPAKTVLVKKNCVVVV